MNEPEETTTPDNTNQQPAIEASEVTPGQLAAVTARLDAYEQQQAAAARKARARSAAEKFTVRVEPLPPTMFREDCIEIAIGGVDKAHREDIEVAKLTADTNDAFETLISEGQRMDASHAHLNALATGLEYGDKEAAFPLLAAAWLNESRRITNYEQARYDRVIKLVDSEVAHLEKQVKMHATLARSEITCNLSTHVAQEIRHHFRSMPVTERFNAIRQAVSGGDKETLTALLEPGTPRYLMGVNSDQNKLFDSLIDLAERTMAPKHVARREAALNYAKRLKAARERYHQGSERFSQLSQLAKNPALKQRVEAISKIGSAS